jgi:hypothetical protein
MRLFKTVLRGEAARCRIILVEPEHERLGDEVPDPASTAPVPFKLSKIKRFFFFFH